MWCYSTTHTHTHTHTRDPQKTNIKRTPSVVFILNSNGQKRPAQPKLTMMIATRNDSHAREATERAWQAPRANSASINQQKALAPKPASTLRASVSREPPLHCANGLAADTRRNASGGIRWLSGIPLRRKDCRTSQQRPTLGVALQRHVQKDAARQNAVGGNQK